MVEDRGRFLRLRKEMADGVAREFPDRVTEVEVKLRDCNDVPNFLRRKRELEAESHKRSIDFD